MGFLILAIVACGLVIGAVLGWLAFNRTRALEQRVAELQKQIWRLKEELLYQRGPSSAPPRTEQSPSTETPKPVQTATVPAQTVPNRPRATKPSPVALWLEALKTHWMIWLGGACIGLAGIFMVRYGIEQGLLGPAARITLAVLTGLVLHGAAEFLRRRLGAQPAIAALAGGASITLYAGLLAALHLYQLLSPTWVFSLLAVISFATMLLALRHGPMLAAIGLLGAYGVPLLVSTGSNNLTAALIYALIVSAAALVLLHYVYRSWLWLGTMAGMLFWGVLFLSADSADLFRPFYLALLAWALLALPAFDWRLARQKALSSIPWRSLLSAPWRRDLLSLLSLLVLLGLSLTKQAVSESGLSSAAMLIHLPFVAVLFIAARRRDDLAILPWLSLFALLVPVLLPLLGGAQPPIEAFADIAFAFTVTAAVFSAGSLWLLRQGRHAALWASLAFLSPVIWIAACHLLFPGVLNDAYWAAVTVLLGAGYVFVSSQRLSGGKSDVSALWLLLAGHAAYSVAVAIAFEEAGLTLALALQLISLTWAIRRYQLGGVDWLIKVLVAVVVARLTFNPWLLSYPDNVHWSLWTYGGATACCVIAARMLHSGQAIRRWLEAAALHLLVLTLATEIRYWLYDGNIFAHTFNYLEAAINANLWAALALVYHYRGQLSQHLARVYAVAAKVLFCMSLGAYVLLLTVHNPYFLSQDVAQTPIVNSLLLAYGLPVVMAALAARYYLPGFRRFALGVFALAFFVFVNLEIRHLWSGDVSASRVTSSGELYTYSLVWLLIAIGAVVQAARKNSAALYKAGMGMLLAVIAKIFVVDMSDLAGLLRVASFMGLGLALLGLSYLHRRLSSSAAVPDEQ